MIELKVNFAAVDSGEFKDIYTDCSLVMQTAGRHPCNIGYVVLNIFSCDTDIF
jgi:hypothetical protein